MKNLETKKKSVSCRCNRFEVVQKVESESVKLVSEVSDLYF